MYQTATPVGRRRSKNAERQAEIMRQHFSEPVVFRPVQGPSLGAQILAATEVPKGECPTCRKTFKRLDKHRCKG